MLRLWAFHAERMIFAAVEKVWLLATQAKNFRDHIHFEAPVARVFGQFTKQVIRRHVPPVAHAVEQLEASFVIDRATIVRIDQAEVPKLIALIDIGYTRGSKLQQRLRQAVV